MEVPSPIRNIQSVRRLSAATTLLVATLGFHAEKLTDAVPRVGADEVWFYVAPGTTPTKQSQVDQAVAEVEAYLRKSRLPFRRRDLPDPFNYPETLQRFVQDLRGVKGRNVVFNLTGGPKTMTVAATVACLLLGIPVLYIPEEEENPSAQSLPILRVPYDRILPAKTRRVLEGVHEHGPIRVAALAGALKSRRTTLDYHLGRLEEIGAVTWVPEGKRRRVTVSPVGEAVLLGGRE